MASTVYYLFTTVSRGFLLAVVAYSAFGDPLTAKSGLAICASAISLLWGVTYVGAAIAEMFAKGTIISAERLREQVIWLLLLAGMLCIYVGGRSVWLLL
jgi:hypothetical protein